MFYLIDQEGENVLSGFYAHELLPVEVEPDGTIKNLYI